MKILTIVSDLSRGGTQRVAADIAIRYQQHGHNSAVLTMRGSGPRAQDLTDAGVQLFLADQQSTNPDTPWNTQAKDWAPDVIHFHRVGLANPIESNLIRYLKKNQPSKIKVIEHSHFGRCDRSKDRNLIDVHIQISKWCLWKWIKSQKGLPNKPVGVYIPHMVDASQFTAVDQEQVHLFRDQHNIPRDAFVYGYLAQSLPPKWSSILFDSFKAVAQHDKSAYLMIAGIDEQSKSRYKDFPQEIQSRIIVLPFIKGDELLCTVYSAMDTFVLATDIGETFGLVLAEAMCCNTPVVAMANPTRGNGQSEVVGHRRGGLIAANKNALVDAMKCIKEDSQLLQECGIQGREYIIQEYNQEFVMNRILQLLEIIHQSKDRESLRETLKNNPDMISTMSTKEIQNACGGMIGSFSFKQKSIQRMVLSPHLQSCWNLLIKRHRQKIMNRQTT